MRSFRRYIAVLTLLFAATVSLAQTRELADSLIEYGSHYIGKPYRRAGNGPSSFDCSGFTRFVYGHYGIDLPHNSAAQGKVGRPVEGDISTLQKGDLVLFSGSRVSNNIGHVGIFIELDPSGESFSFIHASISDGVRISHSDEDYYRKRFRAVRRVLPDFEEEPQKEIREEVREGAVIEMVEKLPLGENDMRVVLFDDGQWKIVDAEGVLHDPDPETSITLSPNGRWTVSRRSSVALPSPGQQQAEQRTSTTGESGAEYYTIKSGDTLYKIAQSFHTTIAKLCELNGISQKSTLRIGQKLRIR